MTVVRVLSFVARRGRRYAVDCVECNWRIRSPSRRRAIDRAIDHRTTTHHAVGRVYKE